MQQEQLRHQYLDAMGISSWLPCSSLPGAKESSEWVNDFQYPAPEIPFESDRAETARGNLQQSREALTPSSSLSPKASASIAALSQAIEQPVTKSRAADASPAELVSVEEAETKVKEQSPPPNFKLAFTRIGSTLVVDSLPPQGGNFSANYQYLSQAIVNSIGLGGEPTEPFMLPWPIFASKTLDQSREQAVIAVQHKLNKELQKAPLKAVLLFGEAAAQMVLDRAETIEQLGGVVMTLSGGVKVTATLSLTEAMQLPGAKKQIWQDLQGLISQLNQPADV